MDKNHIVHPNIYEQIKDSAIELDEIADKKSLQILNVIMKNKKTYSDAIKELHRNKPLEINTMAQLIYTKVDSHLTTFMRNQLINHDHQF